MSTTSMKRTVITRRTMHLPLKWHRMLAARIRQRNFASARLVAWRGRMRSAGDRAGLAETLSNLSVVAEITGDLAASSRYLSEAISLRRELGERHGEAAALYMNTLTALGIDQTPTTLQCKRD